MLLCISLHLEDIFHENIINDIRVIESNKKNFLRSNSLFRLFHELVAFRYQINVKTIKAGLNAQFIIAFYCFRIIDRNFCCFLIDEILTL